MTAFAVLRRTAPTAPVLAVLLTAAPAGAANITPDVIFGDGNANGSFTIGTGSYTADGGDPVEAEIGLRAKLRFDDSNQPQNLFNYDGVDTYTFPAISAPGGFGFDPNSPTTPVWNFEWHVASDLGETGPIDGITSVDALTYVLRIDGDPGSGTDFFSFDPINIDFADHAFGDLSTGNGAGAVAIDAEQYEVLLGESSVVQNSWNYEFFNENTDNAFFPVLAGFDPTVPGTYRIEFEAFLGQQSVMSTGINVVTQPVAPVPLPAGLPLLLGGLGALALLKRARRD